MIGFAKYYSLCWKMVTSLYMHLHVFYWDFLRWGGVPRLINKLRYSLVFKGKKSFRNLGHIAVFYLYEPCSKKPPQKKSPLFHVLSPHCQIMHGSPVNICALAHLRTAFFFRLRYSDFSQRTVCCLYLTFLRRKIESVTPLVFLCKLRSLLFYILVFYFF